MQAPEGTEPAQVSDSEDEGPPPVAVLGFQHDAAGSGVSRRGNIRPGGRLIIEYDPARLPPTTDASGDDGGIVCHVCFRPGGQSHSAKPLDNAAITGPSKTVVPRAEFSVPSDATTVELWFERRAAASTAGWDSKYGQNYTFAVVAEGLPVPEPSVALRAEAAVDPTKINVVEDAAHKEQTVTRPSGRSLHTGLVIRALTAGSAAPADVWADIHVFDAADELIHAGSVNLLEDDASPDGHLFSWHDDVYKGSGGGSGVGVWRRPDAHTIQYRLYCRVQASEAESDDVIFTDGVLHEFEVPADQEVASPW